MFDSLMREQSDFINDSEKALKEIEKDIKDMQARRAVLMRYSQNRKFDAYLKDRSVGASM